MGTARSSSTTTSSPLPRSNSLITDQHSALRTSRPRVRATTPTAISLFPRNHDRRQRTMTHQYKSYLEIEDRGAVLIVRVDGGPHSLFGLDIANELDALVSRVDRDPNVHAVVFTGGREGRV